MESSDMKDAGKPPEIAVIGSGLMGHGIAQVFAQGDCRVRLQDIDKHALQTANSRIRANLKALSEHELEDPARIDAIMSKIATTTDLAEALTDVDFVIESAPEDLRLKTELFGRIESFAPDDAILASNTSMLKVSDIGVLIEKKERLIVTHWFNPPYLMPVVEVVKGAHTSQDTMDRTIDLLRRMGKVPIRVLKEVPGHLLNRIQFAMFRETIGLLEQGVATAEEIDKGVSGSLGLRLATIGPLKSIDLAGIDLFWYGMRDSVPKPRQFSGAPAYHSGQGEGRRIRTKIGKRLLRLRGRGLYVQSGTGAGREDDGFVEDTLPKKGA